MVEEQEIEAAKIELLRKKAERLAKNDKVKEYWRGKRLNIQLEEVNDRVGALNLSTEWVDVERMDNEEMDVMMDMTEAVVDVDELNLSLAKDEQWLDVLMMSVIDNQGVTSVTISTSGDDNIGYIGGEVEDVSGLEGWEDETLLKGLLLEDWVENEMETLNITMDIGPEQVSFSEQEDMALGLEITTTESYVTPSKTKQQLEHEALGKTLRNMNFQIEDFGPTLYVAHQAKFWTEG